MNFKKFGRTANLFDGIIASGYYNDNGILVADQTTSHSTSYIPVTTTTYTISGLWYQAGLMANFAAYEWDSNKNWLRRSNRQYPPETNVITFTIGSDTAYITLQIQTSHGDIMLNVGSTALPYQPYKDWNNIPHYIHKTSTDTITTLPADIYANDTTATVGLKGNMEQSGTPTPVTPIQPSECGERTGNLLNPAIIENGYNINTSSNIIVDNRRIATTQPIDVTSENTVTITYSYEGSTINCIYAIFSGSTMVDRYASAVSGTSIDVSGGDKLYLCWYRGSETITKDDISNLMLNTGSTPLPYEPYGIKIPILNNSQTTNVYLGEVQSTRNIKKLVLTGQETTWNRTLSEGRSIFYNTSITPDYLRSSDVTLICTHYVAMANVERAADTEEGKCALFKSVGVNQRLYIADSDFESVGAFKAYLAQQYANGTPVTVWYVLATEETGTVNEPLRKIGTYADEVSGITIPVTAGANTISVGTTLQPSEVTVNYKGWHPVADVHEKSAQLIPEIVQGGVSVDGSFTNSTTRVRTVLIPVKPNTTYSVSSGNLYLAVGCYYKNSAFAGQIDEIVGVTTSATFTVPENANQIAIGFRTANGTTNIIPSDLQNYMLNEGETALPYEPYWT